MFFKLFALFFLAAPFLSFSEEQAGNQSESRFLSEFTCFKDMSAYYPAFVKGELEWQKQKRFFRCLHDTLELFVEKGIFTHDSSRDYFTKEEIFKMFHWYFNYEEEKARQLTDKVFAIKKVLIGGLEDQLKDKEINAFYKLIRDYEKMYFIIHKHIPVFYKIFNGSSDLISPEEMEASLSQIRNAFVILERAYKREDIVYPISGLHTYHKYFKFFSLSEAPVNKEPLKKVTWFLHNLFEGLFSPKTEIKGEDWRPALNSLYETLHLLFHYKTYFSPGLPSSALTYRILESAGIFVSSLQSVGTQEKKGFSLSHLDEMLSTVFSFMGPSSVSAGSFKPSLPEGLLDKSSVPLLTRAFNCFSLDRSSDRNCQSHWGNGEPSSPVVTLSFEDLQFEIFSDEIKTQKVSDSSAVVNPEKLQAVQDWIEAYKSDILHIQEGRGKDVAVRRHFHQWLSPFFGWEKNKRIEFGSFHTSDNQNKSQQILSYHALLQILFSSYLPEAFSSSEEGGPASLSLETWKEMIKDLSPVLVVLKGKKGYEMSWRSSFVDLFHLADSFLYSSDMNGSLSSEELMDLTVHFMEGVKSVKLTDKKAVGRCADSSDSLCLVKTILEDEEILAAYPRFQKYLFDSQISQYTEQIHSIFKEAKGAVHFLPLFILIQLMGLNYDLIDRNQSFNLESEELAALAEKFEEPLAKKIPYISSKEQARSYLMYSFYTGNMPFFTGDRKTPVDYTHWHLNPEAQQSFVVTPNEFHFLIFDFYNLYRKY